MMRIMDYGAHVAIAETLKWTKTYVHMRTMCAEYDDRVRRSSICFGFCAHYIKNDNVSLSSSI